MRERRKPLDKVTLLAALLLVLLAGVSYWLVNINQTPPIPRVASAIPVPDYTMDNFTAVAMSLTGEPEHRLRAQRLVHFPHNNTSTLTQPHMTIFRPDAAPWQIHAEYASASDGRRLIVLRDDVLIENPEAGASHRIRLTTRDLRVLPEREYAETDQPVTIRQHIGVTHATGMRADLKAGRVQLLNDVRGTYEP